MHWVFLTLIIIFAVLAAAISWLSCGPQEIFSVSFASSNYCESVHRVPGDFPSMIVEVFFLGTVFAVFGSLFGALAARTSSRKKVLTNIDQKFEKIMDAVRELVLIADQDDDETNQKKTELFAQRKNLEEEFNLQSDLILELLNEAQGTKFREFSTKLSTLLAFVPKTAKGDIRNSVVKMQGPENSTAVSFKVCARSLFSTGRKIRLVYREGRQLMHKAQSLDDKIIEVANNIKPRGGFDMIDMKRDVGVGVALHTIFSARNAAL